MKRILITGADSYIGTSVEKWLKCSPDKYGVETLDMQDASWENVDFSRYDVVFHVAGIAHADTGKISEKQKKLYYDVNTKLTVKTAQKAKTEGVKQFIFMSSIIIYSGCRETCITKHTIPKPLNCYGGSKWLADKKLQELETEEFKVAVLRPPMIYGKGSKGNYPELAKLATKLPVFPKIKNRRSMLHIDNLCEFVKLLIDYEDSGVFFPQNREYAATSEVVKMIADARGHRIIMISGVEWAVRIMMKIPGRMGRLASKAFGDLVYEMEMSGYEVEYRKNTLAESIKLTEV